MCSQKRFLEASTKRRWGMQVAERRRHVFDDELKFIRMGFYANTLLTMKYWMKLYCNLHNFHSTARLKYFSIKTETFFSSLFLPGVSQTHARDERLMFNEFCKSRRGKEFSNKSTGAKKQIISNNLTQFIFQFNAFLRSNAVLCPFLSTSPRALDCSNENSQERMRHT